MPLGGTNGVGPLGMLNIGLALNPLGSINKVVQKVSFSFLSETNEIELE